MLYIAWSLLIALLGIVTQRFEGINYLAVMVGLKYHLLTDPGPSDRAAAVCSLTWFLWSCAASRKGAFQPDGAG